ncbi:MAG: hypothetical protein OEQ74_09735 [Gammaproteobacteria bacterium]|nr:hypothetical protein [Gammaproteobacteria bacterium]
MSLQTLTQMDARRRNLIALGLIGILVTGMLVYVVLPEIKEFHNKSTSRSALIGIATDGNDLLQQIDSRMQAIDELTQRLHGDSANLPPRQMESFVIGRLQKISWDNNIELISVRPGEGERVAEFREMLFKVELEGGYIPVHRWLWAVRKELGFVVIKEFSLVRADQSPVDPRLQATLTLASYRMAGL